VPVAGFARPRWRAPASAGTGRSAEDGRVRAAEGEGTDAEALGIAVAERLLAQGARDLIDATAQ
jgi:hypothetical protein